MGYSVQADWQTLYNVVMTAAQFTLINDLVAVEINTFIFGTPATDVSSTYTSITKMVSDQMIIIYKNFLKESSMENPPEFIHYKLPHFTPLMERMLNHIKIGYGYIGGCGTG
jgi:hypothetical protein